MSELSPPQDPNLQQAPVVDPSVLGGNVTPPSDEELYKQKVELLEGALQEQTNADVAAQSLVLLKAVGGPREAARVNIWEGIKKQDAYRIAGERSHIIIAEAENILKPEEEKDVVDKVVSSVADDIGAKSYLSPSIAGYIAPESTDFNAGNGLKDLIETGELNDPSLLDKATTAIRLLAVHGLYKLHKWGNADQLRTALVLMETYAEQVPDFNPKEAGFDELKASLTMALAALQVDQNSKPNYQAAKPERGYLAAQTAGGLKQLRHTEAHMFLRYRDFDLPQPTENQQKASSQA